MASLFFGRQQWFPPTKIGRSRTGPFQFHFQGKRDFWWSLCVKYSCSLLPSNGKATLDWAHRPSSLSPKVCSYFLCGGVWATSLNSSRHVCPGGGSRGGSNQVASLWQPRCNSNSRQCKKVSGWLGWQTRTDIKNFTTLPREPSYTIISLWLWKNQKVGSNHQH